MKRTFVFQEGNSQKFWDIELNGNGFTVNYGRLGTNGQFSTKTFETEEKCKKEAEKLINEKLKKGYNELSKGKKIPAIDKDMIEKAEKLKKEKTFNEFSEWLDGILENTKFDKILAFNFNLYEGDNEYHIQIIGSDEFDEEDEDWACSEIFTSGDKYFIVNTKNAGEEWFEALEFCVKIVTKYLENGKNKEILLKKRAVGIGFTSGDLYIIYKNGIINKNIKIEHDF